MDTVDLKLAQDCEALAVSASEGVGWLKGAAATPLVTAGLVTVMFGQVICRGYVGPMPVHP